MYKSMHKHLWLCLVSSFVSFLHVRDVFVYEVDLETGGVCVYARVDPLIPYILTDLYAVILFCPIS